MSPAARAAVGPFARAVVHAAAFLLSGIAAVYLAVGLSLPFVVAVPLTIGSLSLSPVIARRAADRILVRRPVLDGSSVPGRSPTH